MYVMFVGSWIGILGPILVLSVVDKWPHPVNWAKWEYGVRLLVAVGFMLWEAFLLWGRS